MGEPNVLSDEGGVSSDPLAAAARERITSKKGKSGSRQAVGAGRMGGLSGVDTNSPEFQESMRKHAEALQRLWSPSSWARVASFPLDAAMMATGRACFDTSETERNDMGEAFATFLQFWSGLDPKWLALGNLIGTLGSVYGAHFMLYRAELVKEQAEAALKKVA